MKFAPQERTVNFEMVMLLLLSALQEEYYIVLNVLNVLRRGRAKRGFMESYLREKEMEAEVVVGKASPLLKKK